MNTVWPISIGVRHHRLAGIALSLGLLAATMGLAAQAIRVTVLDPQRVEDGASELLESDAIRDSVRERIVDAVSRQAGAPFTDRATLEAAANEALKDPEVERAFEQGIGEVSRRMFEGNIETPVVLDPAPLTRAVKEALMRQDQQFGFWLPDRSLMVTVPTDDLPDLSLATSFIETAAGAGLLAALLLIGGAVAFHDHRPWAVGRIGRWMSTFGGTAFVMTAILPRLLLPEFGDLGEIAGSVVAGTSAPLVWPAAALACAGFTTQFVAARWTRSTTERQTRDSFDRFTGHDNTIERKPATPLSGQDPSAQSPSPGSPDLLPHAHISASPTRRSWKA